MIIFEILTYVLGALMAVFFVLFILADIYEQRAIKEERYAARKLAELRLRQAYEEGYWNGRGY